MEFVVLDLEWASVYSPSHQRYINEIIEFGAVKLDDNLKIIDTFSTLVKPTICKKLNSRVKALTHITMDELKTHGISFVQAIEDFADFASGTTLVTWSTSDVIALIENLDYFYPEFYLDFFTNHCDVQPFCEDMLGIHDKAKQASLSTCCSLAGISYDADRLHRALEDARKTSECFVKLYNKKKIKGYILPVNEDFFRRITFKTRILTSETIHNDNVGKIKFSCPHCDKKIKQKGEWIIKNKSFRAEFFCNKCNAKLIGIVSYKEKFDGLVIRHKVIDVPVVTDEAVADKIS